MRIRRIGKYLALFLLGLALCQPTLRADGKSGDDNTEAKELYAKIKNIYTNIRTFNADVKSRVFVSQDMVIEMEGVIAKESDDKWLITLYRRQNNSVKVLLYKQCDGVNVWNFENNPNRQIFKSKYKADSGQGASATGKFMPGFQNIDETSLSLVKTGSEENIITAKVIDNSSAVEVFNIVKFHVDKKDESIKTMNFFSADGKEKMSISFQNIRINQPLDQNLFKLGGIKGLDIEKLNVMEVKE